MPDTICDAAWKKKWYTLNEKKKSFELRQFRINFFPIFFLNL